MATMSLLPRADCVSLSAIQTAIRLVSRPKSAHEIDDDTYQQNQTKSSATYGGTTEVKTASTE